ncbi:MAG: hypothetical protein NVS3B20_14280 [Polyangiales bacterium]
MIVKKYGNRRLYDTKQSRYITLEELAEKIRQGQDARVIDAKTGDDLTQATLTQIILESHGAARLLPVPLLMHLVRMSDDALGEFFSRYVTWALEVYVQSKQSALNMGPFNPFASSPFGRMFSGAGWGETAPPPTTPGPSPRPPSASSATASSDVDALRRELAALKRTVNKQRRR